MPPAEAEELEAELALYTLAVVREGSKSIPRRVPFVGRMDRTCETVQTSPIDFALAAPTVAIAKMVLRVWRISKYQRANEIPVNE
jgi:hypothetical protein